MCVCRVSEGGGGADLLYRLGILYLIHAEYANDMRCHSVVRARLGTFIDKLPTE